MLMKSEPALRVDIGVSRFLCVSLVILVLFLLSAIYLLNNGLFKLLMLPILGLLLLDIAKRYLWFASPCFVRTLVYCEEEKWKIKLGDGHKVDVFFQDAVIPFGQLVIAVFSTTGRQRYTVFMAADNCDKSQRRRFRKYCFRRGIA